MSREPKDNLERFIIDHRSELDSVDPPEGLWESVSRRIRAGKSNKRRLSSFDIIWRAAAIFFFGITVYFTAEKFMITENEDTMTISEGIYQEFFNAESYYVEIIQVKKQQISEKLNAGDPLNSDFQKDIAELDSMYNQLKRDFEQNNDELVVDAMVYNLRLRIKILDKQLKIIENINKTQNDEEEGVQI